MKKDEILKKVKENELNSDCRSSIYKLQQASKASFAFAIIVAVIGIIGIIICFFQAIITVGYAAFFTLIILTIFLSTVLYSLSIFLEAFSKKLKDNEECKKLQKLLIEIKADEAE